MRKTTTSSRKLQVARQNIAALCYEGEDPWRIPGASSLPGRLPSPKLLASQAMLKSILQTRVHCSLVPVCSRCLKWAKKEISDSLIGEWQPSGMMVREGAWESPLGAILLEAFLPFPCHPAGAGALSEGLLSWLFLVTNLTTFEMNHIPSGWVHL